MAAFASSLFADAALSTILNNVDVIAVCSGQPLSYTSAFNYIGSGGQALAKSNASGADFTIAAATSGRQLTVGSKTGVSVTVSGVADHVVLLTTTGSILRYGTTATSQVLTAGNSLTVNQWIITVKDPNL